MMIYNIIFINNYIYIYDLKYIFINYIKIYMTKKN